MNTIENKLSDLMRLEDVLDAFVVTTSGTVYTVPNATPKIKSPGLVQLIYSTVQTLLNVLASFQQYGAERMVIELQDVIIFINSIDSATALVCVTPQLVNTGLLEVEMENARREIRKAVKTS